MRSRILGGFALLCAAAFVGCGAATTEGPGGGGPVSVMTAQQFERAFNEALCDQLYRCLVADDDLILARALLSDRAACARQITINQRPWNVIRPSLAAGTLRYDPAAGARCIARLRGQCLPDEPELKQLEDRCPDVFVGNVALGGSCRSSEDCQPDAWCDTSGGMTPAQCAGTCRPRVAVGATCDFGARCAAPSGVDVWGNCDSTGGASVCTVLRVGAPVAEGQPCGRIAVAGRPEISVIPCQDGLWCTERTRAGTCRRPIAVGAACASSNDVCANGAVCPGRSGGATCTAFTLQTVAGSRCGGSSFTFCSPVARLACSDDDNGTCVSTGSGAMGTPCRSGDFGDLACQDGLVCRRAAEGAETTCQVPAAIGGYCTSRRNCASGFCDSMSSRCVATGC